MPPCNGTLLLLSKEIHKMHKCIEKSGGKLYISLVEKKKFTHSAQKSSIASCFFCQIVIA